MFLYSLDYFFSVLQALKVFLQRTEALVEVMPCTAEGEFEGVGEGFCLFWRDRAENRGLSPYILSLCLSKGEKLQCLTSVSWRFHIFSSLEGS